MPFRHNRPLLWCNRTARMPVPQRLLLSPSRVPTRLEIGLPFLYARAFLVHRSFLSTIPTATPISERRHLGDLLCGEHSRRCEHHRDIRHGFSSTARSHFGVFRRGPIKFPGCCCRRNRNRLFAGYSKPDHHSRWRFALECHCHHQPGDICSGRRLRHQRLRPGRAEHQADRRRTNPVCGRPCIGECIDQ